MIAAQHSRAVRLTQDWRPGTCPAVPTGLLLVVLSTQDFVLGYSLPSLRDWFGICLETYLFLASSVRVSRSKKANLDKSDSQPSLRDLVRKFGDAAAEVA
jgi:hypothetical protein